MINNDPAVWASRILSETNRQEPDRVDRRSLPPRMIWLPGRNPLRNVLSFLGPLNSTKHADLR
jgi:hypothetical protein